MQRSLEPGRIILDKYRVERVLGRGGMGVVVAARHLQLDELFAIKVLSRHALNRSTAVERFVREAQAAARLKNEHVVRVHDVGTFDDGVPYMVMEYLDGQGLDQELSNRGPLPVPDATQYVYQICEGMLEAHAQGIVHRDLKPANLLVVRHANGLPSIKVLDFGISKVVEPVEGKKKDDLTETGAILGSPMYMSPEQIVNGKVSDVRTDIWAIGAIFYELLRGRPPFQVEAFTDLVLVLKSTPASVREARADVPDELEKIIFKCLEKHPRDRFQSVSELMTALQPFMPSGNSTFAPVVAAPATTASLGFHGKTATLPLVDVSQVEENGLSDTPQEAPPTANAWETTEPRSPLSHTKRRWIAGSMAVFSMVLGGIVGLMFRAPTKTPAAENATSIESGPMVAISAPEIAAMPSMAPTAAPSPAVSAADPMVSSAKPVKPSAPAPRIRKRVPGHESND